MRITDNRPVTSASEAKKKPKAGGASSSAFADALSNANSSSSGTSEVSGVSATASVGNLLALQEVSDDDYERAQTIRQGQDLLKSLDSLRQSLLLGNVPSSTLETLEGRLKIQRAQTVDPKLHAIMDDIELRAAVELAKYQRNNKDSNQY